MSSIRVFRWSAVCAVVLAVVFLPVSVPVTAAGTTSLTVSPTEQTASTGDTLTFDIVVENASGGVGAWEGTLNLTDGDVADITGVTLHGDPGLSTVEIAADNDSVYFDGALADTNNTGPVAIVTVSIELTAEGQTTLDLRMDALGDEQGDSYTVAGVTDARAATGEITETPTASPTPTPTPTGTDDDSASMTGDEDATDTAGGQAETDATANDEDTTTRTRTATTDATDTGDESTDGTESTETAAGTTAASSTATPNQQSAPGFTGVTALLAVCLSVAVLLRRRS